MIRFHFEDDGQDFLWWDVEDLGNGIGRVVDAGPFQAWAWANGNIHVNLGEPHGVGDRLVTTDDLPRSQETGYSRVLHHRVTRVEHFRDGDPFNPYGSGPVPIGPRED